MNSRLKNFIAAITAATAFMLIGSATASATTFCVPDFSAACPNNGTNIKSGNLQTAFTLDSFDGKPDTIYMGATTNTTASTLQADDNSNDDLTIIGSGTDKSFITTTATNNGFVLNTKSRALTMSGVTVVIPSTFPDNAGAGIQADDVNFDHVDIESLNPESGGAPSLNGESTWTHGHIYGANGGSIGNAVEPNIGPGRLVLTDLTIDNAVWGIVADKGDIPVIVKQSHINSPVGYAAIIEKGSKFVMENTVIVAGNTPAIYASTGNGPTEEDIDAAIRSTTIVAGKNPSTSAFKIQIKAAPGSQDANFDVTDSIIRGFADTWDVANPSGVDYGVASMTFRNSNFDPVGLPDGPSAVSAVDPSNINADPKFTSATDFHLLPGSPSIDAASTADTGITQDVDGTIRPLDGNGDGTRVRDMGAYEAPEVPTCQNEPATCPKPADKTAPVLSKVKFRAAKKKAGKVSFRVTEAATVTATFKPKSAKKHGRKLKTVTLVGKANAGAGAIKVKKGKLRPGTYKLTVSAVDAASNVSAKWKALTVKIRKLAR